MPFRYQLAMRTKSQANITPGPAEPFLSRFVARAGSPLAAVGVGSLTAFHLLRPAVRLLLSDVPEYLAEGLGRATTSGCDTHVVRSRRRRNPNSKASM